MGELHSIKFGSTPRKNIQTPQLAPLHSTKYWLHSIFFWLHSIFFGSKHIHQLHFTPQKSASLYHFPRAPQEVLHQLHQNMELVEITHHATPFPCSLDPRRQNAQPRGRRGAPRRRGSPPPPWSHGASTPAAIPCAGVDPRRRHGSPAPPSPWSPCPSHRRLPRLRRAIAARLPRRRSLEGPPWRSTACNILIFLPCAWTP